MKHLPARSPASATIAGTRNSSAIRLGAMAMRPGHHEFGLWVGFSIMVAFLIAD
jgi:hypothetical protein